MFQDTRLHNSKPRPGAQRRTKRLGCGESSGHGKTSGKGHKGQKARSGGSIRHGFEGGQMPLIRRIPKRGFNNKQFKTTYFPLNLHKLEELDFKDLITETVLRELGIVRGSWDGVKILATGEITKPIRVKVNAISQEAQYKIAAVGGSVELIPRKSSPTKGKGLRGLPPKLKMPKESGTEKTTQSKINATLDVFIYQILNSYTEAEVREAKDLVRHYLQVQDADFKNSIQEAEKAKNYEFLAKHNVHGIGYGRKWTNGLPKEEKSIRFYVYKKLPERYFIDKKEELKLPKAITLEDGTIIKTDVVELSLPEFLAGPGAIYNNKYRSGTIGAYCYSNDQEDKKEYILSCKHILYAADDDLNVYLKSNNRVIGQRGRQLETRQRVSGGRISVVVLGDAAIAEVNLSDHDRPKSSACHLTDKLCQADIRDGDLVYKLGGEISNRPGIIHDGNIFDTDYDCILKWRNQDITYVKQILVTSLDGDFAKAGDSGTLIIDKNNKAIIGICFAGSMMKISENDLKVAYVSPISVVLQNLKVKLK